MAEDDRCLHDVPKYLLHFFFFNDPATTEIYPLPLHDALPISVAPRGDSVSPRCSTGQGPVVTESRVRNHTTTPLPPFAPWRSRPPRSCPPGPVHRNEIGRAHV